MDLQSLTLTSFRLFLGVVFLRSFLGKVSEPRRFIAVVINYNLIPSTWARSISYSIITAETTVAILLLIGWQSRIAAALSGILLGLFILALGINLLRGHTDMECGCSMLERNRKISLQLIGRNLFLLLVALLLIQQGGGLLSLDNQSSVWQRYFMTEFFLPFILINSGLLILIKLVLQLYRLILLVPLED